MYLLFLLFFIFSGYTVVITDFWEDFSSALFLGPPWVDCYVVAVHFGSHQQDVTFSPINWSHRSPEVICTSWENGVSAVEEDDIGTWTIYLVKLFVFSGPVPKRPFPSYDELLLQLERQLQLQSLWMPYDQFQSLFKGSRALHGASLVTQTVNNPSTMQETQVWFLGQEDTLDRGMATHSSTVAWRNPWTVEPGGLYSLWGCKESDITEWLIHKALQELLLRWMANSSFVTEGRTLLWSSIPRSQMWSPVPGSQEKYLWNWLSLIATVPMSLQI